MLFRQFCCLYPRSSRGWSWHSVPVSKRRRAFSSIPTKYFRKIWAQSSSLKHQRRSDEMASFRDYEIYLLFLLLVKFHGSGKREIYSLVQRILQCFLPCAILSLDTKTPTLYFWTWCLSKWFPNSKVAFSSFFISNFKICCWDFNPVMNEVWITMMRLKSRTKDFILKYNNALRSEFDINVET